MRFMILLKADKNTEAGVPPSTELIGAMMKYNGELTKAGVLLAGEGLQPSSKGTRVKFSAGKRTVIDGPFPELRELIAGFWMFQVHSKEEAIEWVKRCPDPFPGGEYEIEIRQVFEASDETMTARQLRCPERCRHPSRRPARRPVSQRCRVFRTGRASLRRENADDGNPSKVFRLTGRQLPSAPTPARGTHAEPARRTRVFRSRD